MIYGLNWPRGPFNENTPIFGILEHWFLTRSVKSNPFQIPGGGCSEHYRQTKDEQRTENLVSNIGHMVS